MRMRPYFILLFLINIIPLCAQQLPPSVRWEQINTKHYRIIYPREIDSTARKIAVFLEKNYRFVSKDFGGRHPRTPVILNSYYALPNGYVSLMPRHSQWYMMPGSFGRVWYKELGVHEMRHVMQFDAMNRGLIRVGRYLGGDAAQLFLTLWVYPLWFFEGDAVYTETAYGDYGRGFSGYFAAPIKAIALEYPRNKRNYYDFYYRSYKTYYPSHYHLGYHLVAYVNRHFRPAPSGLPGKSIWDKIVRDATFFPFIPGAMNLSLKRNTGLWYDQLTDSTMAELGRLWKARLPRIKDSIHYLLPQPKAYTHDYSLQADDDGNRYFLRQGFDDAPTIMQLLSGGRTKKLLQIPAYDFYVGGHYLLWKEIKTHPRWHNRIWSRPVLYDLHTGQRIRIDKKRNYGELNIDASGRYILAVYMDSTLVPHLEIMQTSGGKTLADRAFPQFTGIFTPEMSPDGKNVAFTAQVEGRGTGIFLWKNIFVKNSSVETLSSPVWRSVPGQLAFRDITHLLWTEDYHGVNVWEKDLETGRTDMLTHRPYKVLNPQADGDSLYFSDYTVNGYRLAAIAFKDLHRQNRNSIDQKFEDYYNPNDIYKKYYPETKENKIEQLRVFASARYFEIGDTTIERKKYNHLRSWFNPHSWFGFLAVDTNYNVGLTGAIVSRDILDETSWAVSGTYFSSSYFQWKGSLELRRWFPVVGLWGGRDFYNGQFADRMGAYVRFPLDFSSGIWYRFLHVRLGWSMNRSRSGVYQLWQPTLFLSVAKQKSYRDIRSRQAFFLHFSGGYEPDNFSKEMKFTATSYLPGAFRHDFVRLSTGFQTKNSAFPLPNTLPVLSVENNYNYNKLWQAAIGWQMPLGYPDWGWKRVFRIKRLRGGPLAEWASADGRTFYGLGGELIADWNLFGFIAEFPVGVRALYIPQLHRWGVAAVVLDLPLGF